MNNARGLLLCGLSLLWLTGCGPREAGDTDNAAASGGGAAAPAAWAATDLAAALAMSDRPEADKARDADRKPAEVLAWAGVAPGMTVMDVMASGGWYTEVLAVAVGADGVVYAENPRWLLEAMNGAPAKALTERLANGRLPNVVRKDGGLEDGTVPPDSVDVALTALNLHDVVGRGGEEAGVELLQQIYAALKPGGELILIDHNGKAGNDNKKLHRIEQATVERMVAQTPFVIEGEGGMLRHPEDDLSQMVFGRDIRGKTDRFVLKLRKPA